MIGRLGVPAAERERRAVASSTYEAGDWAVAGPLWEAIFHDAVDEKQRRVAGRRAVASYRKAGLIDDQRRMLRSLVSALPPDPLTRRELARFDKARQATSGPGDYWRRREHLLYIQVTREVARRIATHADSVVDVGSNATPILSWFPQASIRVSVDLRRPYEAEGVAAVRTDFMTWQPGRTFDVGLCLQVLEHIPDATAFAQRLLEVCELVIISVPYRWPEEASSYHVHDPVDEVKLRAWFGRDPNYSYVVAELDGRQRIICVYDTTSDEAWSSVAPEAFRFRWTLRGVDEMLADETATDPGKR